MASLADIAKAVKPEESVTVDVDISAFIGDGKSGKPILLTWRNPDVRRVYAIAGDAGKLMLSFPLLTEQMAIDVATIVACHVAPDSGAIETGQFYAGICQSNPKLWFHLVGELGRAFPHLKGMKDQEFLATIIELCCQYLHRHPLELEHLPAEILTELKAIADRKAMQTNLL